MSAPGSGIPGIVTVNAGPRRSVGGKVYVGAPAGGSRFPSGEVEIVTEFLDSMRPSGAGSSGTRPSQIVHLSARVQGFFADNAEIVPHGDLLNMSVERSADGGATATFEVRADNPPFGTEIGWKGAVPGKREVSVFAGYATAAGVRGGGYSRRMIADLSRRRISGDGPSVMTITCLDAKFRDDKKKVTYIRDQGHGMTAEDIIRELAFLGMEPGPDGVPFVVIGSGTTPINKAIQIDCEPWIPHAEQLAESVGKALYWNKEGVLTLVPRTPPPSQRAVMTLTEADILAGAEVEITGLGTEVPTSVVITGETVTKAEECGIEVQTIQVSVFEDPVFFPGAVWTQSQNGNLSSSTGVPNQPHQPITGKQEVHRTVRITEVKCGTILSERVLVWEWKNPSAARYTIDSDGDISGYASPGASPLNYRVYIFNPDAEKDDDSSAFLWPTPRFTQTHESYVVFDYAEHELAVHPTHTVEASGQTIEGLGVKPPPMALWRNRAWTGGFVQRRAALKQRGNPATFTTWEDRPFIAGTAVLGSGQAVSDPVERYLGPRSSINQPGLTPFDGSTSYAEKLVGVTPEGLVESESELSSEIFIIPGGEWWFGEGLISKYQREGGVVTRIPPYVRTAKATSYSAQEGGGGYSSVVSEVDNERSPPVTKTTIQGHEGDLPRATFMSDPDRQIEAQRFELGVESAALLQSHVAYEIEYSNPYLEDPTRAEQVAIMLLREGSALQASFLLSANVALDPWQLVHLHLRRYGINVQVHVMTTGLQWPGWGEAVLTPVTGRIYVV